MAMQTDACPHCAALEAELAETQAKHHACVLLAEVGAEAAIAARALLGELAAAVRARDLLELQITIDPSVEVGLALGDARGRVSEVLRRAEAEAGGGAG